MMSDPRLILLILLATAMVVLLVLALSGPSTARIGNKRIAAMKSRYAEDDGNQIEARMRKAIAARTMDKGQLFPSLLPNPELLAKRLHMTGKKWTLSQYMTSCVGLVLALQIILLLRGMPFVPSMLISIAVGFGLPHFVVGRLIARRLDKFTTNFPDALDLLVRGLRSGLPISETMGVVGAEVDGPVGEEFRAVSDKMKIGRSMDAALQDTADRLGTPEFQFFVITIAIQRETGGNLAETLANLAHVLRQRAQMKLKIRAMSSESKASAYIIGSLPFIVFTLIWFINSSYMQNFFIDQRLMVAGLGGMVWMAIGAGIMAKMINFEI